MFPQSCSKFLKEHRLSKNTPGPNKLLWIEVILCPLSSSIINGCNVQVYSYQSTRVTKSMYTYTRLGTAMFGSQVLCQMISIFIHLLVMCQTCFPGNFATRVNNQMTPPNTLISPQESKKFYRKKAL